MWYYSICNQVRDVNELTWQNHYLSNINCSYFLTDITRGVLRIHIWRIYCLHTKSKSSYSRFCISETHYMTQCETKSLRQRSLVAYADCAQCWGWATQPHYLGRNYNFRWIKLFFSLFCFFNVNMHYTKVLWPFCLFFSVSRIKHVFMSLWQVKYNPNSRNVGTFFTFE